MKDIAVFLDRDGTINEIEETDKPVFVTSYEKFHFYDDVADAIKILNSLGVRVIVTTNQPSVARGLCIEEQVEELHVQMISDLKKKGAFIDAAYFCPHHPETHHKDIKPELLHYRADCECRKPKTGMLKRAANAFGIDLKKSFVVGDRTVDVQHGRLAGCRTILVKTGMSGRDGKYSVEADFVCNSLKDAAKLIERSLTVKAVILAGGRGERLRPLTDSMPKPMIPVAGRPVLEHQISVLKKSGITSIVLCASYMVDTIKGHFGDGSGFGVSIEYPHEPEQLGSGGAVKNAEKFLRGVKRFVVINGDKMFGEEFDFSKMLDFDDEKKGFLTVLVRKTDHPVDSDVMRIDSSNKVVEFLGRGQDKYNISNSGVVVARPSLLDFIPEGKVNLENDVVFKLVDKRDVYAFVLPEGWFTRDMGTQERLASVRKHFEKAAGNVS